MRPQRDLILVNSDTVVNRGKVDKRPVFSLLQSKYFSRWNHFKIQDKLESICAIIWGTAMSVLEALIHWLTITPPIPLILMLVCHLSHIHTLLLVLHVLVVCGKLEASDFFFPVFPIVANCCHQTHTEGELPDLRAQDMQFFFVLLLHHTTWLFFVSVFTGTQEIWLMLAFCSTVISQASWKKESDYKRNPLEGISWPIRLVLASVWKILHLKEKHLSMLQCSVV